MKAFWSFLIILSVLTASFSAQAASLGLKHACCIEKTAQKSDLDKQNSKSESAVAVDCDFHCSSFSSVFLPFRNAFIPDRVSVKYQLMNDAELSPGTQSGPNKPPRLA